MILFAVYLVLMELICLGPLLIFVPLLARTRRTGLRQYSILADTYNRAFEQKFLRRKSNESHHRGWSSRRGVVRGAPAPVG